MQKIRSLVDLRKYDLVIEMLDQAFSRLTSKDKSFLHSDQSTKDQIRYYQQ